MDRPTGADEMKIIRVVGFANGQPCPVAGHYLETFDFEAAGGLGYGEFTLDSAQAMKFLDAKAALDFWRTQSATKPMRSDGKPNRPLTCTTIEVADYPGEAGRDESLNHGLPPAPD